MQVQKHIQIQHLAGLMCEMLQMHIFLLLKTHQVMDDTVWLKVSNTIQRWSKCCMNFILHWSFQKGNSAPKSLVICFLLDLDAWLTMWFYVWIRRFTIICVRSKLGSEFCSDIFLSLYIFWGCVKSAYLYNNLDMWSRMCWNVL